MVKKFSNSDTNLEKNTKDKHEAESKYSAVVVQMARGAHIYLVLFVHAIDTHNGAEKRWNFKKSVSISMKSALGIRIECLISCVPENVDQAENTHSELRWLINIFAMRIEL